MATERLTRRRAIALLAATAIAGGGGMSHAAPATFEWRGTAMGADARLLFCGVDPRSAQDAAAMTIAEIERLERALSLFRENSEICTLNRYGVLEHPSGDLRRALALAVDTAEATGGLFDPTVQALWQAHVDWFAAAPEGPVPPDDTIAAARAKVNWRRISLAASSIRLAPGQRITLNGLGQGYVTDRVADLLRARGFAHVLVDLGEQRALGPRPDGEPWLIARAGGEPVELRDGALATSEGAGCILGAAGAAHHLFDPRSGRSAPHWRRISVHHRSAAIADAFSTALFAAAPGEIQTVLSRLSQATVWATDRDGREWHWKAPSQRDGLAPSAR